MALAGPWVVLIWVARFVFFLLPFPVSPGLSLFWEPTRLEATGSPEGRGSARCREGADLVWPPRTLRPLAVFRRGGGCE